MDETTSKQEALDKRYIRMASIWAENSYCQRRQVGALIVKINDYLGTDTTARHPVLRMYAKTKTMSPNRMYSTPKPMPPLPR